MFIGNHRGFSRHFHGFRPCGNNSNLHFDAIKTIHLRWFALGWFAAKFALKTRKLKTGFRAAALKYFDPTLWKLGAKSVPGMAIRCKIKPSKFQSPGGRNLRSFIGEYRYGQTCRRSFYRNVLPNVRRYLPSLSAPCPDEWPSSALGRRPTYLSEARRAFKCAPKPPIGDGFSEGARRLYRIVQRCRWTGA
jgi:hypothetical protein